ncbi:hypothetical protein ACHAWF_012834 [Thalassiosira exigua]
MSSGKRAGPRARLKTQKCRDIAQSIMERERSQVWERQNDSPYDVHVNYESTAKSSQHLAVERMVKPSCLDVCSEEDMKKMAKGNSNQKEAVTYWSHELVSCKPHFPVTPLKRGSPLFARCTGFSNDIEDSRLRHDEADELASGNE